MTQLPPADLADRLHKWMTSEMRFHPQGRHCNTPIPSKDALQYVCRGQQMQDVWKFVLDRVRSVQTVKTVQGNLALMKKQEPGSYQVKYESEKQYSQEKADLMKEKSQLMRELNSDQAAVLHLEQEVERLRREITKNDRQCEDTSEQVHSIEQKCALLSAHSQQVDEDTVKLREYATRMTDKADSLTKLDEDKTLYSKPGRGGERSSELETASARAVRESCEKIASFLSQLLQGAYSNDRNKMYQEKDKLWREIENDFSSFTATEVVSSISLLAQSSAIDLRDKTNNINIPKDAEKLKFKYENGRLTDMSCQPSIVQSVQQLVTERQAVHLQRFLDTEKCRNQTWRVQERLSVVMELLEDHLRQCYQGNEGAMNLARSLFETEVQIAATRAALVVLDETVDHLMVEISEAAREKEALFTKYQKIQAFKKLADNKQNLIRVLVKQNASARGRLELQQEEILQYIDKSLLDHESTTMDLTHQLTDSVTTEVDNFAQLSLPFLMYSLLESGLRLTVLDLSIHRLNVKGGKPPPSGHGANQSQILQHVLTALDFQPYKAPEGLLLRVTELQQEIEGLEQTVAAHNLLVRNIEGRHTGSSSGPAEQRANWQRFQRLCERVKDQDEEEMRSLLPVLQQRLAKATQSLTDCLRLKDTAKDWWEQPAQSTVPWIAVDNANFQQWRNKFTLAVTRLRQIEMSQS